MKRRKGAGIGLFAVAVGAVIFWRIHRNRKRVCGF